MRTVSILDECFQVICHVRVDVFALIEFDWTIFIHPKRHDDDDDVKGKSIFSVLSLSVVVV